MYYPNFYIFCNSIFQFPSPQFKIYIISAFLMISTCFPHSTLCLCLFPENILSFLSEKEVFLMADACSTYNHAKRTAFIQEGQARGPALPVSFINPQCPW